jgi:hypothetical protein
MANEIGQTTTETTTMTYYYAENAIFETLEQAERHVAHQPLARIWTCEGYASFEELEAEFEAWGSNGISTGHSLARN